MKFPILERQVHGKRLVYLDTAASSQKSTAVLEAMRSFDERHYANVHRGIHTLAEEATEAYEGARATMADFISASPEEIILTSSTTDGLNRIARMLTARCSEGEEIVVTLLEHHSNFVPWQQLAEQLGLVLKTIRITPDYRVDMVEAKTVITDKTAVVACTHVSNVTGTIVPIDEIAALAHEHGAHCVVDGAQAVAHMPVNVRGLGVDAYAFSGHKMYGPTGIGVLYVKREVLQELEPVTWGGSMVKDVTIKETRWADIPARFEPGTPNISQAVGLAAAVRELRNEGWSTIQKHENEILTYALERLETVEGVTLVGPATTEERKGVLSFVMEGVHPHDVASVLDGEGVAVRAGHHCAQPLHCALGLEATARASIAIHTTREDIDALVVGLRKVREVFP